MMGVLWSPESGHSVESRKWEAQLTQFGPAGRPYEWRPFPMMLHKVARKAGGGFEVVDTTEVGDEAGITRLRSMGFYPTPTEAVEALEAFELECATLAAERAYEKQYKLSPKAVAEVTRAEEAGHGHLPTIPEQPKKRRGRPVKLQPTEAKE